jgi:Ca-activated chloride channel family protein
MKARRPGNGVVLVLILLLGAVLALLALPRLMRIGKGRLLQAGVERRGGELRILGPDGRPVAGCLLRQTDVAAEITGYVARVRVRQLFENPLAQPIEAVYVFPLPHGGAVDEMVMTVGGRRIRGTILPRAEARTTYETAKAAGHVAGLLDQERPNVFTQRLANIPPGARVVIEIAYVETLQQDEGRFEWVFPMVVAPRYTPGRLRAQDSIPPPTVAPPLRAGHDITLTVRLHAGSALSDLVSELHAVDVRAEGPGDAVVTLQDQPSIPNRDFILHYRAATERVADTCFVHQDARGTFFTLVLQPPRQVAPAAALPKEMVFVIDRSGSMGGFPIEKAKETMRRCIERMNPRDTFNLISFSDGVTRFFPRAEPNTAANRDRALRHLAGLTGDGGTEMLPALAAALASPPDPQRLRIVCFMSDGCVSNEWEILALVKRHAAAARLFAFGIGNSVNRFLLDAAARAGRGEVEYVTLEREGDGAAARFQERIQSPVLTDLRLDLHGLAAEVFPRQLPDLFSHKPIMVHGRLDAPLAGTITLRGNTAGGLFERTLSVQPPAEPNAHEALPALWARAKVAALMAAAPGGFQNGTVTPALKQQITDLGVRYRLMTQFTSFVAVEERRVTGTGLAAAGPVPVDLPRGVTPSLASAGRGANVNSNGSPLPSILSGSAAAGSPPPASPPAGPATWVAATAGPGALSATLSVGSARAGDPLIRVAAPPDARQVVALLPGGEVKPLAYNLGRRDWEARFDIPTHAAPGDYRVVLVIMPREGARRVLTLRYRVDTTAPGGTGRVRLASGAVLRLEVAADADTARVAALLPWGERIPLAPLGRPPRRFLAQAAIPLAYRGRPVQVTFVVTDRAHNRTLLAVAGR